MSKWDAGALKCYNDENRDTSFRLRLPVDAVGWGGVRGGSAGWRRSQEGWEVRREESGEETIFGHKLSWGGREQTGMELSWEENETRDITQYCVLIVFNYSYIGVMDSFNDSCVH